MRIILALVTCFLMLSSAMATSYEVLHCEHPHQEQHSHNDHEQSGESDQCRSHCPIPHIFFVGLESSFASSSHLIRYEKIDTLSKGLTATFFAKVDRPPIA